MSMPNGQRSYDNKYIPTAFGPGQTILASEMVKLLLQKLSPKVASQYAPKAEDLSTEYEKYPDTKTFCREVFRETYAPDIEKVMDSVDQHVITIAKSSNGYGKSHAAGRISVAFYKRHKNVQVYTAAAPPETNLDIILWGQIKSIVAKNPGVFQDDIVSTGKGIYRKGDPLSFIMGVPIPQAGDSAMRKAKFSGKHAPYMLFVLDEGDAIPFEIYEAIESCMSGGHVRLLVMFNPRADVGPVSKMEKNGTGNIVRLNALEHPNVVTGQNIYDGAVSREVTVRRINEWSDPLPKEEMPDAECFEVPPYLVGYIAHSHASIAYPPLAPGYRRINNPQFSVMVLAQYPAVNENQLISVALVEKAVARWRMHVAAFGENTVRSIRPSLGADIAEYGIDSTVATLKYGSFVPTQKTWRFCDPTESARKLSLIYKNHRCSYANVDANGVGAGVAPGMLKMGCREVYGLKVQSSPDLIAFSDEQKELGEFYSLGDYMMWGLRHWLQHDPQAAIPDDDELCSELTTYTYNTEKHRGKITVTSSEDMRAKLSPSRSPDKSKSLALAVCGRFEDIAGEIEMDNYIYGGNARVVRGNFIGIMQ